jgi:hypothetical protein
MVAPISSPIIWLFENLPGGGRARATTQESRVAAEDAG